MFIYKIRLKPPLKMRLSAEHGEISFKAVAKWYYHRFGKVPVNIKDFPSIPAEELTHAARKRFNKW